MQTLLKYDGVTAWSIENPNLEQIVNLEQEMNQVGAILKPKLFQLLSQKYFHDTIFDWSDLTMDPSVDSWVTAKQIFEVKWFFKGRILTGIPSFVTSWSLFSI